MFNLIFGGLVGATLAYFFDPENGPRRRAIAKDRLGATARDSANHVQDLTQIAADKAQGVVAQTAQSTRRATSQAKVTYDDATLSAKVKTELFSDPAVKGKVSVNVENGVVVLRGEVQRPEEIKAIEGTTKRIGGVQQVENLLHLPGSPAPTA